MVKLSQIEIGQVQESIDRAVAKIVRRYPAIKSQQADICQDAWIKFLAGYDRARDLATNKARDRREMDRRQTGGPITADTFVHQACRVLRGDLPKAPTKHVSRQIGSKDACPGAYAYTVAITTALDAARNLSRKHVAKHSSLDQPVWSTDGDDASTLANTLAAALDDAPTMLGAHDRAIAVQSAIAALSDAQRDAIEAWLNDQTMTGGQRIAKMRAIDQIQETISAHL